MSVRRPALLVAAVCAGVLVAPQVAAAAPPAVRCGATLTSDAALRSDLTCSGDGLVLEPGVTLDLRGHTLRGSGTGVGLRVSSVGEIEVRNGTLTGWATGVQTVGVDDDDLETGPLTVDRVRFRANSTGVDASGEEWTGRFHKPTTITRSSFVAHTGTAVLGDWFASTTVDATTFTGNARALYTTGDARVTGSRFVDNDVALLAGDAAVTVEGSVFEANGQGIGSYGDTSLTVSRSTFTGSDVALDASAHLDLAASTFVDNGQAIVLGWMGGTVSGNVLRANGEAVTTDQTYVEATTIQGNTLRLNGEGVVLEPEDGGTFLVGGNDVQGTTGRAIHVPGAIDLGGNRARANGVTPQCVGVVCTGS